MKRLVLVVFFASLMSMGAFGLLMAADRSLQVPLPFSIPLATGATAVLAPAVFAIANLLRQRRPIVVNTPVPRVIDRAAEHTRRTSRHGVVLIDVSRITPPKGRAA